MVEEFKKASGVGVKDNDDDESVNPTEQDSQMKGIALPQENDNRNISEDAETTVDIDKENENNEAQETQPLLSQSPVISDDIIIVHEIPEKEETETKTRRTCRQFFCDWDDKRAYYFGRKVGFIFVYFGIALAIGGIVFVWITTVWKTEIPFAMMIWIGITILTVGALFIENSNWQRDIDMAKKLNIVYEQKKKEEEAKEPKVFYGAAFDDIDITDETGQPVQLSEEQVRAMVSDIVGPDSIHSIHHISGQWKIYFHNKPARDEFMNKAFVYRGKDIRKYVIESKTEEELTALAELCALEAQNTTLYGYLFEDSDVVDEDGNPVKLTEDEVCVSILRRDIDPDRLYAVEYIRGVWKIYVFGEASGDKLMKQGLIIRDHNVSLRTIDHSKIAQPPRAKLKKSSTSSGEKDLSGVAILKILNLPVVVEDRLVIKNLQKAGCKVKGAIQKQRVKRQYEVASVYFLNGVRYVRVRIPSIKRFPLKQVWDGYFVKMEVVKVFPDSDISEQNAQLDSAMSALQVDDKLPDANKTSVVTTAICHVENEANEEDIKLPTFSDVDTNRAGESHGENELSRETAWNSSHDPDMEMFRSEESGELSRDTTRPSSNELDIETDRTEEVLESDELSRDGARTSSDDLEGAVGGDGSGGINIPEMVKRVNGDSGIQTPESGSRTSVLGLQMSNQEGEPNFHQNSSSYVSIALMISKLLSFSHAEAIFEYTCFLACRLTPSPPTYHRGTLALSWILQDVKFDNRQFGSLKGRSTVHALVSLVDSLFQGTDKPSTICTLVATDFTKAFDRVHHHTFITKLLNMGLRPELVPWLANFISDRKQRVRYRGSFSEWEYLSCGVAQGTLLGPVLFLVLIDDAASDTVTPVWKYVDDMNMLQTRRLQQPSTLQT
ncbi:hypothetical protein Bbelb_153000 [Branchiostoma belcheri]|nr:hypothetical protein Bbelb_153000 [Branchiostoma belcheri]